jgi:hypothetical protein
VSKIQIANGYKEANPRGSAIFNRDQMLIPEGTSAAGFEVRVTCYITATADDSGGLNTAAQQAILDGITMTFQRDLLASTGPRTPINQETLADLVLDSRRLLERAEVGGVGSATGLQAPLTAGSNILTVVIPVSLAHVEFIDEAPKFAGLSWLQLLDAELSFKVDPEMVKALDSNATLTKVGFDVRVIEQELSEGEREALTPEIRIVKSGEQDSVEGPEGLTLSAEHTTKSLTGSSVTDIESIKVTVGGAVVTDDPATPFDVQSAYERRPNTGTTEAGLKAYRTPLYVVADTPASKLMPGQVKVQMQNHDEDLVVRYLYLPLLRHEEVIARVVRRAQQLDGAEDFIHAVTSPMVEGFDISFPALPYMGWEYFTSEDPRFHELPGLRCKKGGRPFVYMPPTKLVPAATEYRIARASQGAAAQGAAVAVVAKWGKYIPGFITSSKGLQGGASTVFLELRNLIAEAADRLAAQGS